MDKLGGLYTIHLRMIEVGTGEITSMASADCEGTIEEVALRTSKEVVQNLLNRGKVQNEVQADIQTDIEPEPMQKEVKITEQPKTAKISDYKNKKWKYGVFLGFNRGSQLGDFTFCDVNSDYIERHIGFCFGINMMRKLTNHFNIQMQIMILNREMSFGGELSYETGFNGFEGKIKVTQIEVPVSLSWTFLKSQKFDSHFLFGAGIIGETKNLYNSSFSSSTSNQISDKGTLGDTIARLGIILGLGMDFFTKDSMITIDFRFSFTDYRHFHINRPTENGETLFIAGDQFFDTHSLSFGFWF